MGDEKGIKRTTARVPAELHKKLKLHAAQVDMTIEGFVESLIVQYFQQADSGKFPATTEMSPDSTPAAPPVTWSEEESRLHDIVGEVFSGNKEDVQFFAGTVEYAASVVRERREARLAQLSERDKQAGGGIPEPGQEEHSANARKPRKKAR